MFDTGAGVPGRATAPLVASLRSAPVTSGHCRARMVSLGEMSESANTGTAAAASHKPSLDNPGHSRSCEE